jgi:ATP-dependent HslUV protease subunit HslV
MFHATTIVAVQRNGKTAVAGDGQVTFNQNMIMKDTAHKVRSLHEGKIIAGFAGSVADAFTLFGKFEEHIKESSGNLLRASVNLSKEWRTDKYLRQLEALLLVADKEKILMLSGGGEVVEPDHGAAAIGSGGGYALAAARTMLRYTELSAGEIAEAALHVAADICIYTNHHITLQTIE